MASWSPGHALQGRFTRHALSQHLAADIDRTSLRQEAYSVFLLCSLDRYGAKPGTGRVYHLARVALSVSSDREKG